MNLNQMFCWHSYKIACKRSGFYGEACLYRCSKCGKAITTTNGYPEFNHPKKTTITHYDRNGKLINLQECE